MPENTEKPATPEKEQTVSRREFAVRTGKLALGAVVAPMIVPRRVLGGVGYQPPSRTLNVAMVGVGGMGMSNWMEFQTENVTAVCDVDWTFVERGLSRRQRPNQQGVVDPKNVRIRDQYVKAAKYQDFRQMLDKSGRDIDAVVIATPDHMHAAIAYAAMKAGKAVYVQKPLTYSVAEARLLARTAKETGVATQMGNQGHSREGTRRILDWIRAGVIGPVSEVHVWTNRPLGYWAQGIPRPTNPNAPPAPAPAQPQQPQAPLTDTKGNVIPPAPPGWNMNRVNEAVRKLMAEQPQTPPPGLDWDLYLGVAKEVPYHPAYHPFSWRGWVDFGVSAIGDMGAHLIDQPYWALELGYPTSFSASATPWGGTARDPGTYPLAMMAEYDFPAAGSRGPVKMYWYDGGFLPPRPQHLPDDVAFGGDGGGCFIGSKGILVYDTYGDNPRIYPESVAREAEAVPKNAPRVTVSHEQNFVQAVKGEAQASSPISYAAALTETMLLPIVGLRAGYGKKILYDANAMRVTNIADANQWLTREYRKGWELPVGGAAG